jgi:hypothetical protein
MTDALAKISIKLGGERRPSGVYEAVVDSVTYQLRIPDRPSSVQTLILGIWEVGGSRKANLSILRMHSLRGQYPKGAPDGERKLPSGPKERVKEVVSESASCRRGSSKPRESSGCARRDRSCRRSTLRSLGFL